jgi:hypothetical protein
LRTGPLVRRSANVSRAAQAAPSTSRPPALPRIFLKQLSSAADLESPTCMSAIESSCLRLDCRLPISLRHFLAEQLGTARETGDDVILELAARADQATLSKLARAIRNYSTARAHESCAECTVALARLTPVEGGTPVYATLCLKCACVDFGEGVVQTHREAGCLPLPLSAACNAPPKDSAARHHEATLAGRIQRLIEEFRALRIAFGLPHFELDCYVRGNQVTFTWHPLP